jgi:Cys-tRNA(Pro)/Cys-tRNA(Cys) deacylase
MTHPDELMALTGYLRGGCSPIGMKKPYPLFIDDSALGWDQIAVSAGVRGLQILLPPGDLIGFAGAATGEFTQVN